MHLLWVPRYLPRPRTRSTPPARRSGSSPRRPRRRCSGPTHAQQRTGGVSTAHCARAGASDAAPAGLAPAHRLDCPPRPAELGGGEQLANDELYGTGAEPLEWLKGQVTRTVPEYGARQRSAQTAPSARSARPQPGAAGRCCQLDTTSRLNAPITKWKRRGGGEQRMFHPSPMLPHRLPPTCRPSPRS